MNKINYEQLIQHYESCLVRFGDTHLGVDWPNRADAEIRYRVMLELIHPNSNSGTSLLDFGCGTSHFYEYIKLKELQDQIRYSGLDISSMYIDLCRQKFSDNTYYAMDILIDDTSLPEFDYIVMNGVFTEKLTLSYEEMFQYMTTVLIKAYAKAKKGIAFNVMSKQVDWERSDLFHVPFDEIASFVSSQLSRNFAFRQDYGLFEYTTYVYRNTAVRI